ncbi:MAG TPA: 50S ribosomal protein L13 [Candidatus Paceibacterota bacterium]
MSPARNPKNYDFIFDARDQTLGRLASQVALALRGKTKANFLPSRTTLPHVLVKNVYFLRFNEKRLKASTFWRYSGYPSGRHEKMAWEVAQQNPQEVLRHAIWGMLPKNKLQSRMIKNLTFYHGDEK